jgi:hypothetical protein
MEFQIPIRCIRSYPMLFKGKKFLYKDLRLCNPLSDLKLAYTNYITLRKRGAEITILANSLT